MVRTIKTVIVIGAFLGLHLSAESPKVSFSKAAMAYRAGYFERAAQLYESINPKGPGVWFNMGNCKYELGNCPDAIVAWKRAQQGASFNVLHSIDHNISMAYKKLGIPFEQSVVVSFLDWGARCIHPFFLQILFLLCWYLLWMLIIYRRRMKLMRLYCGALCVLLLLSGSILLMHYTQYLYKPALVVKKASLLAGPHEQYDVVKELPLLQDVQIREERPGWYKVAAQDQTGWVLSDSVETV